MRRRPESKRATGRPATRPRPATPGTASKILVATYWCLPLVLAAMLWQLSLASSHAIRHEEVVESVRNVLWLDDRLIYDGVYSNVGWYGTLLVCYKLFGFSLTTAKVVRLAFYVAGLYASAVVFRRYMSARAGAVPLILLGTSPTVLYFGSQQTSFGLDLSYAAICLALVLWIHPRDRPLSASLLYVRSPQVLLLDPETGAGLFRGGGQFGWNAQMAWQSLVSTARDLFVQGRSYYFDVRQPDFSGLVASVAGAIVTIAAVGLAVRRVIPAPVALAVAVLAGLSLIVPSLAIDGAPGIRRSTGILTAFWAAFALVWHSATGGGELGAPGCDGR